ncbi:IPT/TIG domain-containing protein [Tenacibaculum sp. S7007]|uniref:IPT/TIG domain-containing protein n=1 Tax=Tenacibaculum pelagium TaxID=2759527 RepID=A0A839AIU7_9FLAO|nr:IPT/TIG domain-containing protein [Tenacibaculum pelagium]MBA6155092.1 IPT/TIG domain-containing protein [Tenacibaculum pelagium]
MRKSILLIALTLLIGCKDEEEGSLIPIIETLPAAIPSGGGVILTGNIVDMGKESVVSYGFELFANSNNIYYNVNHLVDTKIKNGRYTLRINHGLYPDVEYFYNAYIETENETYQGERFSFLSKGSAKINLNSCLPNVAHIGDTVKLVGENFPAEDMRALELRYGYSYAKILSVTENEIEFIVPKPEKERSTITIEAYRKEYAKDGILQLYKPIITGVEPKSAFYSDTITVVGKHFDNVSYNYHSKAYIGTARAEIVKVYRDSMRIIVPNDAVYNNTKIRVFSQDDYSSYDGFSLYEPKFTNFPREVYFADNHVVSFDRKIPESKARSSIYFGGVKIGYFENNGVTEIAIYGGEEREHPLVWKVSPDKEIVSDFTIKVINPFYKIKQKEFPPFRDAYLTASKDKVYILATDRATDGRYLYSYNFNDRKWNVEHKIVFKDDLVINSFSQKLVYSEYQNQIYGVTSTATHENFFKLDINTGNVTKLSHIPLEKDDYANFGDGFTYKNDIYFVAGKDFSQLWKYNVDLDSWSKFTDIPFNKERYRGRYVCMDVKDNFVYFNNGADGNQYSDFWRLNIENGIWERLADNPNPKAKTASYVFNNEIHYVSDKVYKYDTTANSWTEMYKPGLRISYNDHRRVFSFKHNSIPYIYETKVLNSYYTDYNLYIGDLVE